MRIVTILGLSLVLTSTANAVHLSPDRTGQVLLYPYYTANAGNQTLITVSNNSVQAKVIKIRFHESRNARTVLSMNVFLGPKDMWTGAVFAPDQAANTPATLISSDTSCAISDTTDMNGSDFGVRFSFSNLRYTGALDDEAADSLDRTREGHIEIIEMATINRLSPTGRAISYAERQISLTGRDCRIVRDSGNADGSYGNTGFGTTPADFLAPTGLLSGTVAIVDAAKGTLLNYTATALDAFRAEPFYTEAASEEPNLSHADPRSTLLLPTGPLQLNWGDAPVGGALANGQRIDAVSSVLAAAQIYNEYNLEAGLNAKTEWVLTFPTKRFYTDPRFSGQTQRIRPFEANGSFRDRTADSLNCVPFSFLPLDRDEKTPSPILVIFPGEPAPPLPVMCNTSTVIQFQVTNQQPATAGSPLLGAKFGLRLEGFRSGKAGLSAGGRVVAPGLPFGLRPALGAAQTRVAGVPVIGFSAIRIENNNAAPGIQAFYDAAYDHSPFRACSRESAIVEC